MLGGSVVLRLKPFTGRIRFAELAHVGVLAGHGAAPPAAGVYRLREGQGLGGGEARFAHVGVQVLDDGIAVQQRGFGLLHDDAAIGQDAVAIAEEVGLEQAFRRAYRVGGIHNDHVHAAVFTVAHVLHAVFEQQLGAAVAVGLAQFREVFLGIAGDHFVDVDLGGFFHAGVTQHFTQGAAVAATDDDDALGVGVAEQHRVRHHLVVEEVVAGGEHGGAIDGHQVTEGVGFPHLDVLILGLHFFQLLFQAQAESGAGGVEVLVKPVVFGAAHGGS